MTEVSTTIAIHGFNFSTKTAVVLTNARVKGHLEPTHLKSSPLFTFSTKSLGHDSPLVHLFL